MFRWTHGIAFLMIPRNETGPAPHHHLIWREEKRRRRRLEGKRLISLLVDFFFSWQMFTLSFLKLFSFYTCLYFLSAQRSLLSL